MPHRAQARASTTPTLLPAPPSTRRRAHRQSAAQTTGCRSRPACWRSRPAGRASTRRAPSGATAARRAVRRQPRRQSCAPTLSAPQRAQRQLTDEARIRRAHAARCTSARRRRPRRFAFDTISDACDRRRRKTHAGSAGKLTTRLASRDALQRDAGGVTFSNDAARVRYATTSERATSLLLLSSVARACRAPRSTSKPERPRERR